MKTTSTQPLRPPTPNLRRILVPTDFSDRATQALRYAVPLARQLGGKISVLHVLDWPVVPATVGFALTDERTLAEAARRKLAELAQATVPPELLDRALVRTGRAYHGIVEAARELRLDLIVMATQGRVGLEGVLLGSTAERVVRHAACPVLTVRSQGGVRSPGLKSRSLVPRINRILVPVDFSIRSEPAVRFAASLAQTMIARIGLLHVVQPLPVNSARYRAEIRRCDAEANREARRHLRALAALVPKGIRTDQLLRQDVPHRGIMDTASEWRCDLLVLATRGRTGVEYIVLGSTAERVVRHAQCPVLTLGRDCLKP